MFPPGVDRLSNRLEAEVEAVPIGPEAHVTVAVDPTAIGAIECDLLLPEEWLAENLSLLFGSQASGPTVQPGDSDARSDVILVGFGDRLHPRKGFCLFGGEYWVNSRLLHQS